MKTWSPVIGVVLAGCMSLAYTFASYDESIINWGFDGILRAKEWVSPDGRMSSQNQLASKSTALDMWPTSGARPTGDSLAEITLNRYQWDNTSMERFNMSAMADPINNGAFRFGVERGGTGMYRDVIFCFENTSPGVATCPLKLTTLGVYVLNSDGTYSKLGY